MTVIIWTLMGFLAGSIPFALLIGKLVFNIDIRNYGDGNPGATNLWKAKSFGWGAFAYFFDFFKGALPAGLCYYVFNITDWGIVPIALAPVAGHAFSPFLRFHGGKAIATTYGMWAGLTFWEVPVFLALSTFFFSAFQKVHSWIQVLVMLSLLLFILLSFQDQPGFHPFIGIWVGNFIIIVAKHAGELHSWPQPQPWIVKLRNKFH
jgi:acyl phosphate:glycerol-3-phosphate acyltransferase